MMQFADKIQKVLADQEGRDAPERSAEEPIDFSAGYAQIEAFAKIKEKQQEKTPEPAKDIPVPSFLSPSPGSLLLVFIHIFINAS